MVELLVGSMVAKTVEWMASMLVVASVALMVDVSVGVKAGMKVGEKVYLRVDDWVERTDVEKGGTSADVSAGWKVDCLVHQLVEPKVVLSVALTDDQTAGKRGKLMVASRVDSTEVEKAVWTVSSWAVSLVDSKAGEMVGLRVGELVGGMVEMLVDAKAALKAALMVAVMVEQLARRKVACSDMGWADSMAKRRAAWRG